MAHEWPQDRFWCLLPASGSLGTSLGRAIKCAVDLHHLSSFVSMPMNQLYEGMPLWQLALMHPYRVSRPNRPDASTFATHHLQV